MATKKTTRKKPTTRRPRKPKGLEFTEPVQPIELVSTAAMFTTVEAELLNAAHYCHGLTRMYQEWAAGKNLDEERVERNRVGMLQVARNGLQIARDGLERVLALIPAVES